MKFLIAGLGNPGAEYAGTRHNIGFEVLDHLAREKEGSFSSDRHGYTYTLRHKGKQLILLKPTTFMNLSGKAVRHHLTQHKIPQERLLVVTDDLALPLGRLRMRGKGSSGGHNGLQNIQDLLGDNEWARLRFGIGNNFSKGKQVNYVLDQFSGEEQPELPALIEKAGEMILSFSTQGLARTMSQFNN